MQGFHSGGLGPAGELDVISKRSFPFATFPWLWGCDTAVRALLMQQVTRASSGVDNHCKVVMSINDNSRCAERQDVQPSPRCCQHPCAGCLTFTIGGNAKFQRSVNMRMGSCTL